MVELRADPELAAAAGYRELGSAYLLATAEPTLDVLVKEVDARLPGSVSVVDPPWSGVPAGAVAVLERHAGHLSPAALRGWALAGLSVEPAPADPLSLAARVDALVLATGRWTPTLLAAAGLPGLGLRTKAIQYALHPARGWTPPVFVDETTGLRVRPAACDQVLLGVPSTRWDPVTPTPEPELVAAAARAAYDRFGVDVGEPTSVVAAADAYADPPVLALRPAADGVVTFTGGSGEQPSTPSRPAGSPRPPCSGRTDPQAWIAGWSRHAGMVAMYALVLASSSARVACGSRRCCQETIRSNRSSKDWSWPFSSTQWAQ